MLLRMHLARHEFGVNETDPADRWQVLRLRDNAIGEAGARALAQAVTTCSDLEELDVGINQVRPLISA